MLENAKKKNRQIFVGAILTGWERERLSVSNAPVFVSEAPVL